MRRMIWTWLAGALITSVVVANGQEIRWEKPAPEFTLKVEQIGYGGTLPGYYAVLVTEKNISKGELSGSGCIRMEDGLNLIILYNGVRMPPTDAVKRLEERRRAGGPCYGDNGGWKIAPGEEHFHKLLINNYYYMSRPGSYEITVTKDTTPGAPEFNTVVISNTITIVVPKPATRLPQ